MGLPGLDGLFRRKNRCSYDELSIPGHRSILAQT